MHAHLAADTDAQHACSPGSKHRSTACMHACSPGSRHRSAARMLTWQQTSHACMLTRAHLAADTARTNACPADTDWQPRSFLQPYAPAVLSWLAQLASHLDAPAQQAEAVVPLLHCFTAWVRLGCLHDSAVEAVEPLVSLALQHVHNPSTQVRCLAVEPLVSLALQHVHKPSTQVHCMHNNACMLRAYMVGLHAAYSLCRLYICMHLYLQVCILLVCVQGATMPQPESAPFPCLPATACYCLLLLATACLPATAPFPCLPATACYCCPSACLSAFRTPAGPLPPAASPMPPCQPLLLLLLPSAGLSCRQ